MPVHFSKRQANRRRARSNPCRSGALFRPESVPVSRNSPPWAWQAAETGMSHRWAPGRPPPSPRCCIKHVHQSRVHSARPGRPADLRDGAAPGPGPRRQPAWPTAQPSVLRPRDGQSGGRAQRGADGGAWSFPADWKPAKPASCPSSGVWGRLAGGAVTGLHTHCPSHTRVDGAPPGGAAAGDRDAPRRTEGGAGRSC